ncbi:hypothetical protein ACMXYV_09125 [Neptuniibacter sp. SY11_33]|uniref:hypothetical protein n=1 Tax=Neptuniibacter sp. SY11_33 TaxID=3398215 RepID=UPI0039F574DE
MGILILKSITYGGFLGLALTILYAALTTKFSGRHAMTGQHVELSGLTAMFAKIGEIGVSQFLVSLVPTYLLVSFVAALAIGTYKWFSNA